MALDDADANRVTELRALRDEAVARCPRIAFDPARHPDPRTRNRAATLLDRLHADQRPELDWRNNEYWAATIPAGPFVLGDDNGDSDEKPAFVYAIRQPYALARFPVTNRQYVEFLEDLERRGKGDEAESAARADGRAAASARAKAIIPVVDVYLVRRHRVCRMGGRAVAYSGHARTSGETVRLPAEPEWERAAAYRCMLPPNNPGAGKTGYAMGLRSTARSPKLGEWWARSDRGKGASAGDLKNTTTW